MKAAAVMRALEQWPEARQTLVHTGQHYDANLSDVFFSDLGMPPPDADLDVGSGTQEQTTYLGVPCLTLRTERPLTVTTGTNVLIGQNSGRLRPEPSKILEGRAKKGTLPPFGMGKWRSGLPTPAWLSTCIICPGRLISRPRKGDLLRGWGKNAGAGKPGNSA
jgi:UDP-N-acetylglucosamine 2-epimerase